MAIANEELIQKIESMTVLELHQLVEALKDKFGVTAAVPVATGGPAAPAAAVEEAEIQTSFDVILQSAGDKKINVIKVVREVTTLGLKEAKDLVDSAPAPIKEGITKEEADALKAKLEEQGAQVTIK